MILIVIIPDAKREGNVPREPSVVFTYMATSVLQGVRLKNALHLQKKDYHMALRIEVL